MSSFDAGSPSPKTRRRSFRGAVFGFVLVVIVATAVYGVYALKRFHPFQNSDDQSLWRQQFAAQQAQIDTLQAHLVQLDDINKHQIEVLSQLQAGAEQAGQRLTGMSEDLHGGRERVQLANVGELLQIAADRAQLGGDMAGASTALGLAQEQLGAIGNPQLFEIRKAIANEKVAVDAAPKVDIGGAVLSLGALIDHGDQLPLKITATARIDANPAASESFDTGWRDRLIGKIRAALRSVFTVRRTENTAEQSLPLEAQGLTRELLMLKLELARAALLRGDDTSLHAALLSAHDWLLQNYRASDPAVSAAIAQIERLEALQLVPPDVDLGQAIVLLRRYLDSSAK